VVGKLIKQRLSKNRRLGKSRSRKVGTRQEGPEASKKGAASEKHSPTGKLVDRIRNVVHACLPTDRDRDRVSKGDDELLELGGRKLESSAARSGVKPGTIPSTAPGDSQHLEGTHAKGGQFLLFRVQRLVARHYREFARGSQNRKHRRIVKKMPEFWFRLFA